MTKVEKIQDLLQDIEEDTRQALLKELVTDLKHDGVEPELSEGWYAAIRYIEDNYIEDNSSSARRYWS